MKIQVENVSPVERKVSIEVDPDRVAQELERAYVGLGRRVKLRGFRPGKAPRKVLERQFRAEIEGEVLEKIVQQTFAEAVKVEAIPLVAPPHVSVSEGVADGKPVRYTARVEVKPSIEPKDYRGLEISRKPPEVTDQMVSDELSRLQESMAQLVPVEGRFEAQEGDWAVIDHEGTIDGAPFEGGKAEGVTVKVAPGSISEGNLEALKGKRLDETIEIDEPFAQDHRVEELRGKVAHMKVTLRALKTRQLPALDDALAKEVGIEGIETLDALRARIRADLEKREKRRAESEVKDALVKAALAKNEFEVPPALVERAIDAMLEGAAERFARSGIDIRRLELDFARMRADMREQALLQVRGALLLEAIADAEKIEVTDEDLQAEAARIAEELGAPLAKVQQQIRGKDAREALKNRVREDKALALLSSTANIQQST
jgi:trigger factor